MREVVDLSSQEVAFRDDLYTENCMMNAFRYDCTMNVLSDAIVDYHERY